MLDKEALQDARSEKDEAGQNGDAFGGVAAMAGFGRSGDDDGTGSTLPATKKLTGKKAKDARKAEREAKEMTAGGGQSQGGQEQACNVCKETFPSRSKLFAHIKETGHAIYDPSNPASMPKQMKGKKKR